MKPQIYRVHVTLDGLIELPMSLRVTLGVIPNGPAMIVFDPCDPSCIKVMSMGRFHEEFGPAPAKETVFEKLQGKDPFDG